MPYTRTHASLILDPAGLRGPIMRKHVVQRSVRAWVVGGGARKETRAIKNTGFLLGAKGSGKARNREGIVIFENFGQNLRAPDGRLGMSLFLSFAASDIVNGADTARCRMDRSFLAS